MSFRTQRRQALISTTPARLDALKHHVHSSYISRFNHPIAVNEELRYIPGYEKKGRTDGPPCRLQRHVQDVYPFSTLWASSRARENGDQVVIGRGSSSGEASCRPLLVEGAECKTLDTKP